MCTCTSLQLRYTNVSSTRILLSTDEIVSSAVYLQVPLVCSFLCNWITKNSEHNCQEVYMRKPAKIKDPVYFTTQIFV